MKLKSSTGILLGLTLVLVAGGCGNDGDRYGQTEAQYVQERDQMVTKMDNQLRQVDEQLDRIGARLEESAADRREEAREAHTKLMQERRTLNTQMTELRRAGQNEWKQGRENTQEALDDFASRVEGMWRELTRN